MQKTYYSYRFRLDYKKNYVIWFTNDKDGILTNSENKILCFDDSTALTDFAQKQNIAVEIDKNQKQLDLDLFRSWLESDDARVNCELLLDIWNFFDDVSKSINKEFDSDREFTKNIYDKLFWGSNLPVVTPENEFYEPVWCAEELRIIRETLSAGFRLFQENLNSYKE